MENKIIRIDKNVEEKYHVAANANYLFLCNANNNVLAKYFFKVDRGCECNINCLVIGKGKTSQFFDFVIDQASNSRVNIKCFGFGFDNCLINFNLKNTINPHTKKAILDQNIYGLLLDKQAKISCFPQMIVKNYHAIANHLVDIGNINEEALFYLMSKGISQSEAKKLLVERFIYMALENLDENEKTRDEIKEFISEISRG